MDVGRKKPVYEKIYFPKRPNYECTGEYLASTAQTGQIKKPQIGDASERSVEVAHFLAQKQLQNTTTKLTNTRKFYVEKRKDILDQWKDLQEKEHSLRQNFIRFNQFVKENQEKKERATNKIVDQKQLKEERERKLEELQHRCDEVSNVKANMDNKIHSYKIYEDFLTKVVDSGTSTFSIYDLLKRYEALLSAKKDLTDIQQRDMMKLEKAKSNLVKLIEEKHFIIMGLNNQIANLQARYENANIKALESEELVTEIKNNAVKQMGEIDVVKNSIWNMYVHMTHSKNHPIKIKKDNVEEQMMYINRTLTELSKVNAIIKKRSLRRS